MRKIPAPFQTQTQTLTLTLALAAVLGVACAQTTPEDRVAELRSSYEATLQNFVIREEPLIDEVSVPDSEEAAAPSTAGEPAEGDDFVEDVPVRQDVTLDVLVRHDNRENLPGLTVEVAQMAEAAPDQMSWQEVESSPHRKAAWRVYLDTATIGRGQGNSVVYTLEDVDGVDPGDRFVVTVRDPVPVGERGEYREFSEAS